MIRFSPQAPEQVRDHNDKAIALIGHIEDDTNHVTICGEFETAPFE